MALDQLVVTCEHGGHEVPTAYTALFQGQEALLKSHRGWDPGALTLAEAIATRFSAPLHAATVSRLLVDLNRSRGHPALFFDLIARLSQAERDEVLQRHYEPYRRAVEETVRELTVSGRAVLHLSVHSFSPILGRETRSADIGLLYDPARPAETEFCVRWQRALKRFAPELRVRRNYPYLGKADGFTTYLRKQFPADRYAGVELEVNQKYPLGEVDGWLPLQQVVINSLAQMLISH